MFVIGGDAPQAEFTDQAMQRAGNGGRLVAGCVNCVTRHGLAADDILFERRGAAGIVTLNRPQALNAVTHGMVRRLRAQLDRWADDPAVTRVVIKAAGERAFSAGGDIRALYDLGKAGRHDEALQFWRDEYPLNAAIKNYRKPYVALIDGIVMGGGVGVSVHGSHRVAGDRFSVRHAGSRHRLFPGCRRDLVSAAHAGRARRLLRADRRALRRGRCVAAAARHPSHSLGALWRAARRAERHGARSTRCLPPSPSRPAEGPIAARRAAIDRLFAGDRVEDILDALDREAASVSADAEWARQNRRHDSHQVAAQPEIGAGAGAARQRWDFETCMRTEFRIVSRDRPWPRFL